MSKSSGSAEYPMKLQTNLPIICILVTGLVSMASAAEQPSSGQKIQSPSGQEKLAGTIRRYFESSGSFHSGDLITRSQIRGLQTYLRRVGLSGIASQPRVISRILPDRARLVQLFYKKQGAEVLRNAASKLGGYDQLDMLSREMAGLMAIQEAVADGNHRKLVEYILSRSKTPSDAPLEPKQSSSEKPSQMETESEIRGIYTVDQFIGAVTSMAN